MHRRRRRFGRNVSTVVYGRLQAASNAFHATNEILTEQFCIGACVFIIQFGLCTTRAGFRQFPSASRHFAISQNNFFSGVMSTFIFFCRSQRMRFNRILIKIQKLQDIQFKLRTTWHYMLRRPHSSFQPLGTAHYLVEQVMKPVDVCSTQIRWAHLWKWRNIGA